MAIHDATYATRPETWDDLRWRLQWIAEEAVGTRIREAAAHGDAVMAKLNAG